MRQVWEFEYVASNGKVQGCLLDETGLRTDPRERGVWAADIAASVKLHEVLGY